MILFSLPFFYYINYFNRSIYINIFYQAFMYKIAHANKLQIIGLLDHRISSFNA